MNTRCHCLTLHKAPPPGLTDAPWYPGPHPAVLPARLGPWKAEMSQTRPLRGPFQVWPHSGQLWRKLRIREGTGSCGLWGHLEAQTRGPTPLCGLEPGSEAPGPPMGRWRPLLATELFTGPSSGGNSAPSNADSLPLPATTWKSVGQNSRRSGSQAFTICLTDSIIVSYRRYLLNIQVRGPYLLYLIESSPHAVKKPGS